jgi:hypothetical protein
MSNLFGVAACYRQDLEKMRVALATLGLPKNRVVVVTNGVNPPTEEELPTATVVPFTAHTDLNLPDWWNVGLEWAERQAKGNPFEVFVFNADTWATRDTVETLATVLRDKDLAATGPDQFDRVRSGDVYINRSLEPLHDLTYRLPGYAPLLRGELGLRYDPQFRWWYQDDDIEWQARAAGGTGLVGGTRVDHPIGGNPLTSLQAQYAAEDQPKFARKWGKAPH